MDPAREKWRKSRAPGSYASLRNMDAKWLKVACAPLLPHPQGSKPWLAWLATQVGTQHRNRKHGPQAGQAPATHKVLSPSTSHAREKTTNPSNHDLSPAESRTVRPTALPSPSRRETDKNRPGRRLPPSQQLARRLPSRASWPPSPKEKGSGSVRHGIAASTFLSLGALVIHGPSTQTANIIAKPNSAIHPHWHRPFSSSLLRRRAECRCQL